MESLTIGQLAKRAGVGIETIRFYERKGLISQPPRRSSGYRQYPLDMVRRIQFIRRAKELGFTLREIQELLALKASPKSTCMDVKAQASAKLKDIEGRILTLERMKATLVELVDECSGRGSSEDCPILAALDREVDDETTG